MSLQLIVQQPEFFYMKNVQPRNVFLLHHFFTYVHLDNNILILLSNMLIVHVNYCTYLNLFINKLLGIKYAE